MRSSIKYDTINIISQLLRLLYSLHIKPAEDTVNKEACGRTLASWGTTVMGIVQAPSFSQVVRGFSLTWTAGWVRFSRVEVQPSTGGFANTVAKQISLTAIKKKKKKIIVSVVSVYLGATMKYVFLLSEKVQMEKLLVLHQNKYW